MDRDIAMYGERVDHPAWRGIKEAAPAIPSALRSDFLENITAGAVNGCVPKLPVLSSVLTCGYRPPWCLDELGGWGVSVYGANERTNLPARTYAVNV